VQADRRLVEHVQRADQPEPICDASGCAGPRRRQRAGRARQREVVESDVEQEPEAGVDLLRHPLGDQPIPLRQLEAGEELGRLADRQVADLEMLRSLIVTASVSGFSRAPSQTLHGTSRM
jgi:hypothetical protein